MNTQPRKIVVVGNGMVGHHFVDEMAKHEGYEITVLSAEDRLAYDRVHLSEYFSGKTAEDLAMTSPAYYNEIGVRFFTNAKVINIDKAAKTVTTEAGETYAYDKLVMATGSYPFVPPIPGKEREHCLVYRTIQDLDDIQASANAGKVGVVVGGGLLGLEAAYGLALSGVEVTLVHRNKWLLNRQLDKIAGVMLQTIMEQKNINFVLGHEVAAFESNIDQSLEADNEKTEKLSGVTLTNGEFICAQMAVIATGITPNKELAQTSSIKVNRAILVNDYMQTSEPFISALGECCEHNNATFGLVDPIWAQCITLAERLCNNLEKPFHNAPVPTKLKVSGVQLFSAGDVEVSEDSQCFTLLDKKALIYRKVIVKNGKISGVVLFGDVSSGMAYFDLMQQATIVTPMLPELLIGEEFVTISEDEQRVSIA